MPGGTPSPSARKKYKMPQAPDSGESLARDLRRLRCALWLVNLLVAGSLAVLAVLSLSASRAVYTERVRDTTENLAISLQANIGAELTQVDIGLRQLRDELSRNQGHAQLPAMLASQRVLLPFVEELGITSSRGSVSVFEGATLQTGSDLGAHDFFAKVRDAAHDQAVLSEPLQLGAAQRWMVVLARRLTGADSRFDGIVYALIPADHFGRVLGSVNLGSQGAATLRSEHMRLIARHSAFRGQGPAIGSARISSELSRALALDAQQGFYVAATVLDGVERSNAYRRLRDFPMWVLVGLGTDEVYAPWRSRVAYVTGLMSALLVVLATGSIVGYRSWAGAQRSVQARVEEGERSRALMRNAGDGIHVLDRQGRLVELSDSFARMLGRSREDLLGRHVGEWDAKLDAQAVRQWLQDFPSGGSMRFETQHRRSDGSLLDVEIEACATLMRGGEVLIYCSARDVTERKRMLRQQKAMLDNDLIGMTLVRNRKGVWVNRALERIFGYEHGELVGVSTRALYADEAAYEALGAAAYGVLRAGGRYRTQLEMRRKDGQPVWIDLSGVMLSEDEALWMMVDITALKEHQAQVEHMAFHDPLTGLANRLLLADRLDQAVAAAQRAARFVGVCYLDLDGFKHVNDTHGHAAGDALLKEVASRLCTTVRAIDTVTRLGGDEFVVVLSSLESVDEGVAVVQRILATLAEPLLVAPGVQVRVSGSAGLAFSPQHAQRPDRLLSLADQAMFQAKRTGKNRVQICDIFDAEREPVA